MTHHPGRRASWPVEVRELYDTVVRTATAKDTDAFAAALDRLVMLADQSDDPLVLKAARHACLKLALTYDPEGLAECIATGIEFRSALRPLIDAGTGSSHRRARSGRGSRHSPR